MGRSGQIPFQNINNRLIFQLGRHHSVSTQIKKSHSKLLTADNTVDPCVVVTGHHNMQNNMAYWQLVLFKLLLSINNCNNPSHPVYYKGERLPL